MFEELEYFQIKCGKCGKTLYDPDTGDRFDNLKDMEFVATESDWIKKDDKWYCPNCYYVDDNDTYQITH